MSAIKILWLALNIATFVVWVFCMIAWVRRGAKFPRWVHIMAISLTVLGVISMAYFWQALSASLVFSCLLVPPAVAYGGWLWLFGPWERE
jgi:hypothetical protein